MCDGRMHPFQEISSVELEEDVYQVVRWCPDCGSVVVDMDVDGRVHPGKVMPLKSPTYKRTQK